MFQHITSFAVLFGAVAAQQTTLTIPFYDYDQSSFLASVIGASNGATTLELACPPVSTVDCGLAPGETLIYGPSTYNINVGSPEHADAFTGTQDCDAGTTSAVCTESYGGSEANYPGVGTTTYTGSEIVIAQVVITAGADKLSAGSGASAGGSSTPATASATTTGTVSSTTTGTPSLTEISGTATSKSGSVTSSATTASSSGSAVSVHVPVSGFWAAAAGLFGLAIM